MNAYITTPCSDCGAAVILVNAGNERSVPLDPTTPVYHRIHEPDEGKAFWIEDEAPRGESRRHRCNGGR